MAKEYIEREAAKEELLSWARCIKHPEHLLTEDAMCVLDSIPAADVVSRGVYEQVQWERDVAIEQLRTDYGVGFGEKKSADVVEVVHGYWVERKYKVLWGDGEYSLFHCSECDTPAAREEKFCRNCGARMDGDSNG